MHRSARTVVRAVGAVLLLVTGVAAVPGLAAAADDAQTLADRYAPYVVVREHPTTCGDGEPYRPVPVTAVLGRSDVVLRGPDGQVVKVAPTAADLAGKGEGYYLDLPGDPLSPGCDYARWVEQLGAAATPTVYAHLATDPAHPGVLALQYWFFWPFNDWNDKHEGDWEMVQLLFDASTPAEALRAQPTSVAFAQHEGSEVAAWSSPKVHRDGDHIGVYPGQGSHAAYFTQSRWFGKSAAAGFGCDDTTGPSTLVKPAVDLLPTTASTTGPDAWLSFQGRWGQKEPSFNNGPTGPASKTQWSRPVTWQQDEGRPDAVAIPPVAGPAVDAFCSVVAGGSQLFVDVLASPAWVVGGLLVLLVVVVLLVRRSRWWPATAAPVVGPRRSGQVVTSAFAAYGRHAGVFLGLGAVMLAAVVASAWAQSRLLAPAPTTDLTRVGTPPGAWQVLAALLLAVAASLVVLVVVAAVVHALRRVAEGERSSTAAALRDAVTHRTTLWVALVVYLVVSVLSASLLLLPLGWWLLARWAAAPPAAGMERLGFRDAFRRSRDLSRGRRWRTLFLTLALALVGSALAPLAGAILLLATPVGFTAANLVAAVLLCVLLPVAVVGLTLQYGDLRARAAAVPGDAAGGARQVAGSRR